MVKLLWNTQFTIDHSQFTRSLILRMLNGASQQQFNRSTKAGLKILYLHFVLIRPDFIIFATQNFYYEFSRKSSLHKRS